LEFNVLSPTNTTQIKKNNGITLYPNPTTGLFWVSLKGIENENNLHIELIDLQGQSVFKESVKPMNGQINSAIHIENFSNGLYILKLFSDDKFYHSSLIEKIQ
jgi:hypothetical protein